MTTRRAPRFVFSNGTASPGLRSWARARALHDARSYVVPEARPRTTQPVISRFRTVRRAGIGRSATLVRGWRR